MTEDYNLPEVFHFDESKLPELRERLKRKMWKVLLPVIVGVIALHVFINQLRDIVQLSFLTVTMMILFAVVVNRALKKVVDEYRDCRIITNDKSITSFYRIEKEIEWEYAKLKVKDSGEMIIVNVKLSRLRRFFDERGAIVILPEVENYEKLKLLVFKKAKAV